MTESAKIKLAATNVSAHLDTEAMIAIKARNQVRFNYLPLAIHELK